jgi:hypothetical protein
MGEILAGPLRGQEGVLAATIDLDDIVRARYDLDVAGHYARPDVFSLHVDTTARTPQLILSEIQAQSGDPSGVAAQRKTP